MNRLLHANIFAICFIVLYFVFSFFIGLGVIGADLFESSLGIFYSTLFIYIVSFGIPALIYAVIIKIRAGESFAETFSFHRISFKSLLLAIAAGIAVQPTMMLISAITQLFFENITSASMVNMAQMPLWALLISSAVIPAFFEELVCRGVIFGGYRNTPSWYALVIPALFFGLLHLNFQQAIYAFAGGIFFALLVKATGSLWSSIAAHFTINGLQSVIVYFASQTDAADLAAEAAESLSFAEGLQSLIPYVMMTVVTFPILMLCFHFLFKNAPAKPAKMEAPQLDPYTQEPISWHRGAIPMYAVLGFLFLYTILTELALRYLL